MYNLYYLNFMTFNNWCSVLLLSLLDFGGHLHGAVFLALH